jgi:superfamily II DNA or RNA helicase
MQLACGAGKTKTAIEIVKRFNSSIFIVDTMELMEQAAKTYREAGLEFGYIASGYKYEPGFSHYVSMTQSFARRVEDGIYHTSLVIIDEVHLGASNSYQKIVNALLGTRPVYGAIESEYKPATKLLGLTATPQRLDGKPLNTIIDSMVHGPSVRWLIENKYLADYDIFGPPEPVNLQGIKKSMGDYDVEELATRMGDAKLIGNAVNEYKKHLDGKQCIIFCVNIRHSKETAAQFILAGISTAHVDGETPKEERKKIIQDYRDGKILVLCNVQLYTKGADFPECSGIINLRPTQSLVLYIQSTSRALRPKPDGSKAVILDHAGNCLRHGLPCKEREWSLEGKKKSSKEEGMGIKECPECCAVVMQTVRECPHCGHLFTAESNKDNITIKAGELVDMKTLAKREEEQLVPLRKWSMEFWNEVRKANTIKDLQQIALRCGFKKGYGFMLHKAFHVNKQPIPTTGYVALNIN